MSRAHAVAPVQGELVLTRESRNAPKKAGPRPVGSARPSEIARRHERPITTDYLERAMLLWPRLDRAKLRKVADDPVRIADVVRRRTSQPYEAILAMLTRQSRALSSPTEPSSGFDSGRTDANRVALRIVRSDSGAGERRRLPA
jgi:hypothetical protein